MADVNATRACVVCGATFPRKGKTLSCSDACKHARHLEIHKVGAIRSGRLKGPQQLQCKRCGVGFVGQATKVYCSRLCKDEARDKAKLRDSSKAWRERNIERARARQAAYSRRVRKERPRNRSAEYERVAAKRKADVVPIIAAIAKACSPLPGLIRSITKTIKPATKTKTSTPTERGKSEYTKQLKRNPVVYVATIGRWRAKTMKRKSGRVMLDDGTAAAVAVSLMQTKACLYCDRLLTDDTRTIDHMDPLSKGGVHSASNLCACCSRCNTSKGSMGFMRFVAGLGDKHRRRAVAYYEKLNGFVQQGSLSLGMAA